MTIELLLPHRGMVELTAVEALLKGAPSEPFNAAIADACADLSQRILFDAEARAIPELVALAFWMRKAEIERLKEEFRRLEQPHVFLAPRGLVFHVPPRNVDTMFVYSWFMAALTGNRNVIRLSPSRSRTTDILLRLFCAALGEAGAAARESTVVVSFGHEEEPTALFSRLCDVRVIWGGDESISAIRRAPLQPHARDLTFPDRYSFAAVASVAYRAAGHARRDELAAQFFNDSFWFDQMGCSSPRLLVWCGPEAAGREASADFFDRLNRYVLARGYAQQPAVAVKKLVFSCLAALDSPVDSYRHYPALTVLSLGSLENFKRDHPGGGLFMEAFVADLSGLDAMVNRRDQTLECFGFETDELRRFARQLNGVGIDRIVPFGQALQFGRLWDGYDLLQEFTRRVVLEAERPARSAVPRPETHAGAKSSS